MAFFFCGFLFLVHREMETSGSGITAPCLEDDGLPKVNHRNRHIRTVFRAVQKCVYECSSDMMVSTLWLSFSRAQRDGDFRLRYHCPLMWSHHYLHLPQNLKQLKLGDDSDQYYSYFPFCAPSGHQRRSAPTFKSSTVMLFSQP